MRKSIIITLLIVFSGMMLQAQTEGSLTVNVATESTGLPGKNYAPQNSMVIWIEDENHNFIKTLLVYAQARRNRLDNWESSTRSHGSTFNAVDAITGATKNSHGLRTCTWDGTDSKGTLVPDGSYILHMELTDMEATGHLSEFIFTKGPESNDHSPKDQPSFTSIEITWMPD